MCLPGHQEVMGHDPSEPRSHIDVMIAALAQRQNSVDEPGPSSSSRGGPSGGPSSRTPARSVTPAGNVTPAGAGTSAGSASGSGRNNTSPRQGICGFYSCC